MPKPTTSPQSDKAGGKAMLLFCRLTLYFTPLSTTLERAHVATGGNSSLVLATGLR